LKADDRKYPLRCLKLDLNEGCKRQKRYFIYILTVQIKRVGDDKLSMVNFETGKKMKKAVAYNKRKKYILFGTHYYKKRWFLLRTG
jgi:hypothetical protein